MKTRNSALPGHILLIAVLFTLMLASCASMSDLTPTPLPNPTNTAAPVVQTTALPLGSMDCMVNTAVDIPATAIPSMQLDDRVRGLADARIEIIFYYDLACPYCAALYPVLEQLRTNYAEEARIVYRSFPAFMVHEKALLAAQALEAAANQGNDFFFAYMTEFFAQQSVWLPMSDEEFSIWVLDTALDLGLERTAFEADITNDAIQEQLLEGLDSSLQAGVTYTPYLLINGEPYPNAPLTYETIRSLVELELLEDRQYDACPPALLQEGTSYLATLHTEKGDIVVQLFPQSAPQAVNNFIFLAQQGWYDNIPFYRVIPGSYALSGDPSGSGLGGPGYVFVTEIDPTLRFDRPGMVAMNSTGAPNTNGSNFFITYEAMEGMNDQFTIFGQVLEGMDILEQLTPRDPTKELQSAAADLLLSVTITEQ